MEIDIEALASEVVRVEEFEIAGFPCHERVDAVHGLVRVESGGNIVDRVEAEKRAAERDEYERTPEKRARPEDEFHILEMFVLW